MSVNDSDLVERLHAVAGGFQMPPTPPADDVSRGRRRVRRNRAVVVGAAVAAVTVIIGVTATVGGQDRVEPAPVEQPNRPPNSEGIFANIQGWIVYSGGREGIWAVNPSGPLDQEPKLVTDRTGEPLGWSSDGTKLLIGRTDGVHTGYNSEYDLVVLKDDGTEHQIATNEFLLDGSISRDGSEVVYADPFSGHPGIFIVGAEEGTPRLLRAPEAYFPVFSPDDTQIAFFDGRGDCCHRLRVMNADGTDIRTVRDFGGAGGHVRKLAWTPDGEHLMFSADGVAGGGVSVVEVWVIGVDGSGLTKWAEDDYPAWSPDGSRFSYEQGGTSIAWNPLPLEGGAG